jgi:hypothetical protein
LRKKLEDYIVKMPQMMIYNFSKEKPFYNAQITVTAAEFEVEVLKKENEILIKRLERAQKKAGDNTVLTEVDRIEEAWIKDRGNTNVIKERLQSLFTHEITDETRRAAEDLLSRIHLFENVEISLDKSPRETMFGTLVFYGQEGYNEGSSYP